ncbi:putative glycoside hydrolase [bacterium]|nr:putative glycoside hydrolase [bacterium]
MTAKKRKRLAYVASCFAGAAVLAGFSDFSIFPGTFEYAKAVAALPVLSVIENIETDAQEAPIITHIPTPDSVKAVYMSSWVAGTVSIRDKLVGLIDETEINAVIIDVKDYTGKISFKPEDPYLVAVGSGENRIPDIRALIADLHEKDVYVIGRVAVFQDPYFAQIHPELTVKRGDGGTWKDRKGAVWLDTGSEVVWEYAVRIGEEAYNVGFDEINFDYVRFPSDGNMEDIFFPFSRNRDKREVVREMWKELGWEMKKAGIPSSVDIFGMTTTAQDDMNIGQFFEDSLLYFDFVAPMVYPSHYPDGFNGFANPAANPYAIIHYAIGEGVKRAEAASTSPKKIRAWLQDFDLGADYGAKEVRAQIQALNDLGLDSWMLWDPSNVYTRGALKSE